MSAVDQRFSADANKQKVVDHLAKVGSASSNQICVMLGLSKNTTNKYILQLREAGEIRMANPNDKRGPYFYGIGAEPDDFVSRRSKKAKADNVEEPRRPNVKVWPPNMRRDPLDEAFFGKAKTETRAS